MPQKKVDGFALFLLVLILGTGLMGFAEHLADVEYAKTHHGTHKPHTPHKPKFVARFL